MKIRLTKIILALASCAHFSVVQAIPNIVTPEDLPKTESNSGAASDQLRGEEVFSQLAPSVVLISAKQGSGTSTGTGSFVSADGLILTNHHVISKAEKILVVRYDPKVLYENKKPEVYVAKLVDSDPQRDLALLHIDTTAQASVPVKLGSFEALRVGQEVHAIGHPRGLIWTYTTGFVSQIRPDFKLSKGNERNVRALIQTQTPINPGNSGGPLFNSQGQLIGVNTFMRGKDQEGLNFSVSADDASDFLHDVLVKKSSFQVKAQAKLSSEQVLSKIQAPGLKSECQRKSAKKYLNQTKDTYLVEVSLKCDGYFDMIYRVPLDESLAIRVSFDVARSGKPSVSILDTDRDGLWDYSLMDTDYDSKPDTVGVHASGTLLATKLIPFKNQGQLSQILSVNLKRG